MYIKEVATDSEELRIAKSLVQDEWVSDPRNHCVPVTKVFKDYNDPSVSYMVMPFLRPMDNPPFESNKEIIAFADQILEVAVNYSTTFTPDSDSGFGIPPRERGSPSVRPIILASVGCLNEIQRLRPEEPYDGCRCDVPRRIPPRLAGTPA